MIERRLIAALIAAAGLLCTTSANAGVIPQPRQMTMLGGDFAVPSTVIIMATNRDERHVASFLDVYLAQHGVKATISTVSIVTPAFRLSSSLDDPTIGPEGYRLEIAPGSVTIQANGGAGLYYGLQTLEQLAAPVRSLTFPTASVVDWPRFAWRGIHLDVSRHFFPVSVVEQYIDLAARYKLNTFHWHLTDDQGWRIEIKKYPRLTSVGGCRAGSQVGDDPNRTDGIPYCGYYTRDEIREVVEYASARYVTIVPEIEGPGHSVSAVSAYPWLGCDGKQYPVRETWGVSTQIMCPTERTFGFIDDVLGEVAALFPGPYIHIGGDEVPRDAWETSPFVTGLMKRGHLKDYDAVQGYFTRRVDQIAAKHHRRIVGWDEILDGGVSSRAVVMAWQGTDRGALAARRGNDVVISPDGQLYFDGAQGDQQYEPLSIGGFLSTEMVYDFDPIPTGLLPDQAQHVLGVQANLWTEYVPTADHLFYMLLPRELALAESAWTPRSQMNWSDFQTRLAAELVRFDAEGVPFRIPDVTFQLSGAAVGVSAQRFVPDQTDIVVGAWPMTVGIVDVAPGVRIHYTTDGSLATATSPVYTQPLSLTRATIITAVAVMPDGRVSAPSFLRVEASHAL